LLELKWTLQAMKTIKEKIQQSFSHSQSSSMEQYTFPPEHPLSKLLDTLDTHDHLAEAITKAIDEEYVVARNTKDNREYGFVNPRYDSLFDH
jgi:hypothetical protein